jgi:CRP/FNR family transcriptional regulator, cyclic AMP receptor protein
MVGADELRALDLFSAFSDKQLQELARITTKRAYRSNALIYTQGQPANEIFIIRKGSVSLRSFKSGDEVVLAFELCEPGDFFGAASLMKDKIYTLTALCLEGTETLVIDADKLLTLCEDDFELGFKLMKKVAQLYFDRYEVAREELGIPVATPKVAPF